MLQRRLPPLLAFLLVFGAAGPAFACATGPEKIYYAPGSVRLSPNDLRLVGSMAYMAGEHGVLRLTGHSDTAGPAAANLALTRRRVAGVREALVAAGIPPARILAESFGESRSASALDDGASHPGHRFVLIEILSPAEARKGRSGKAKTTCGG